MLWRDGESNHNNPIYSAGFIEGRKFERELMQEEGSEGKNGLEVAVSVLDLDIVKELAEITHSLSDYVCESIRQGNDNPHAYKLVRALEEFMQKNNDERLLWRAKAYE